MLKGRGVPFTLLLAIFLLRPHLAGQAYPFAQGLFLVPLLMGLALVFLVPVSSRALRRETASILALPWLLLLWMAVSLTWAPDPGQGLRELMSMSSNTAAFTLVFLLVFKEGGDRGRFLPALGLITIPVLASSFYQRFIGLDQIRETLGKMNALGTDVTDLALIVSGNRVFAGFLNPNMLAGFLAITLCLTMDLLLTSSVRRHTYFLRVLIVLQFMALFLTGSAGGSAVAAAMLLAVYVLRRGFQSREIILGCIAALVMAGGILALRGGEFLLGPESSLIQRGGYMAAGLRMALEHPVLGWGAGASPGALMGFVGEGVRPVADPHNFLIRGWIEWGMPGMALLVSFLLCILLPVIRTIRGNVLKDLPGGFTGLVLASGAFLLHSLMDMDFFVPETAFFGWCAMGAAFAMTEIRRTTEAPLMEPGIPLKNMILAATALVLVLPTFLYFQAESVAFRAGKALERGDYAAAAAQFSEARSLLSFNGRFALEEGRARRLEGDTETAVELFEKSRSLMRASPYPDWELGRISQDTGDWRGSIPYLDAALEKYPTSPRIRIDLARSYLNLGEIGAAALQLEEARRYSAFDPKSRSLVDSVLGEIERSKTWN